MKVVSLVESRNIFRIILNSCAQGFSRNMDYCAVSKEEHIECVDLGLPIKYSRNTDWEMRYIGVNSPKRTFVHSLLSISEMMNPWSSTYIASNIFITFFLCFSDRAS